MTDIQEEEKCGVCLEVPCFVATVDCGHVYCYDCIFEWCNVNNSCTICKQTVKRIKVGVEYQEVPDPKVPFEDTMHEYIARRDFFLPQRIVEEEDLPGFVVPDGSISEYSSSEYEQLEIGESETRFPMNVKLTPSDYTSISSRTRSKTREVVNT